jgi:formate-dependent nitrite reductase membrane component NrfD
VFYIEGDTASLSPTYTETPQGYLWSEIPKRVYQIAPPRLEEAESEARRVYDQGQSHVDSWGGKVAAYLWTKSIAAGIPLAAWISQLISGQNQFSLLLNLISILFLTITTVLLIVDLKQPKRFHWIIFRPQWRSWVARGAFILMGFGIFLSLDLFSKIVIPSGALFRISFYLTLFFAVGSAIYSAFLFWQAKGRDLWQSPLFAVHLIVMALLAGSGTVLLVDDAVPGAGGIFFVALLLHAAVIALDLMAVHSTKDAKIAARSMHHKNWLFWIGAVLFGIIMPLILLSFGILGPAGLIALIGLLIYERVWIRAGQIVPLS